ncbi:MAG: low temperature requirement protein A [Thermosynechococcaceae cyanobacterium]
MAPDYFRPMRPRDLSEAHRAATPLELLFDLVTVIAIAAAATGLHHAIAEGHFVDGILRFATAFFGIWWAWMNYTWFASAYDNDDALFRLLTMVIMGGALTIAAGIEPFFESTSLTFIVIGYVVMRLAMVILWFRAALHDPARRRTALWYAVGIMLAQVYWVVLLFNQSLFGTFFYGLFALGAILELAVPALAEKNGPTPWHRHHIIERYGLLTIIVLGETLLSSSMALEQVSDDFNGRLVAIALEALVIVFAMWWLYFSPEEHLQTNNLQRALTWGYGHILIFATGAATGAGFAVLVDVVTDHAEVGQLVGNYAISIPVALYLMGLWFVRDRFVFKGAARYILPIFAALILVVPPLLALEGVAALMVLCVFVRDYVASKEDPSLAEPVQEL